MSLLAGMTLAGRYRVVRRLGEGGMGGVYLVEDARGGDRWALKEALNDATLPPEERAWAQSHFEAEVAIMRQLSRIAAKARIPAYHDDFTADGRRYLVMEYIPGDTLEARIDNAHGPLPERDVLRWMTDVCRAMETLHSLRTPVILRDMKPGNIIITPAGSARVIDFGIARTYKPGQMANTENLGTAAYASPEHHGQGQTDARSDVYSLGATMYHALTGREPQPLEEPTPGSLIHWNPLLSPATEAIVARAMRLDPAQRYQSAREMRAALDAALATLAPAPRLRPTPPAARVPVVTRPVPVPASPAATLAARGAQVADERVCPRCGLVNRPGARFCAHDGAPLTPSAVPGRVVAQAHGAQRRPVVQGAARAASQSAQGTVARPAVASRSQAPQAAPPTHVITTAGATHALRAAEAYAQGRYQQAIQQGEAALTQGHASVEAMLTLARAYTHVGRPIEAAQTFERAAQTRPDAATLVAAGKAWRASGRLTEAQVALSRARGMAPDDAEISGLLGEVNLELGHLAQAEGDFADARRLAPGATWPLVGLGRLAAARGDVAEAARLLGQAAPTDAGLGDAYTQLGEVWLGQRRFSEAIRALERAGALGANSATRSVTLAMAYHATGRRQQAREALREALRLDPANSAARTLLKSM